MKLNLLNCASGLGLIVGTMMWSSASQAQGFCYMVNPEGQVVNLDELCASGGTPEPVQPQGQVPAADSAPTQDGSAPESFTIFGPATVPGSGEVVSPAPTEAGTPGTGTPEAGTPGTGTETTAPGTPGTTTPEAGTPGSGRIVPSIPGTSTPGTSTPGTTTPGTGTPATGTTAPGTPGTTAPETGTPGTTPETGTPGTGTTVPGTPGTGTTGTGTPGGATGNVTPTPEIMIPQITVPQIPQPRLPAGGATQTPDDQLNDTTDR